MFERVIEQGMNRLLAMDPASMARVTRYSGKRVELRLDGVPRSLVIEFLGDGSVFVESLVPDQVDNIDAVLSGSPFAFARAARADQAGAAPAALGIRFEGDVGVAQGVSSLIRDLDIDIEDEIARVLGDGPAYHIGRLLRGFRSFAEDSRERLRDNAGEFLREESGQTVTAPEVEAFLDDVDQIRSDVDRLDRRFIALERAASRTP